jgi:hypothetical protein
MPNDWISCYLRCRLVHKARAQGFDSGDRGLERSHLLDAVHVLCTMYLLKSLVYFAGSTIVTANPRQSNAALGASYLTMPKSGNHSYHKLYIFASVYPHSLGSGGRLTYNTCTSIFVWYIVLRGNLVITVDGPLFLSEMHEEVRDHASHTVTKGRHQQTGWKRLSGKWGNVGQV